MQTANYQQFQFTESDIVNVDDWIPAGEYNPHNVRPFLLHDNGSTLAIVFADCLQDAIDIAVDADKLTRYAIAESELSDYDDDSICHLGNAGEPHDLGTLQFVELPNPKRSFVAQFVQQFNNPESPSLEFHSPV